MLKHFKFSLRALLLGTTFAACFLGLNRIAERRHGNVHYLGFRPDRCIRVPFPAEYGWPAISRTYYYADHPRHESGPCIYHVKYHAGGLAINLVTAVFAASLLVGSIIYVPLSIVWRIYLRRERLMIDRITALR